MGKRKAGLDKRLDAIYSGPSAGFIAGRNELAKSLRTDGEDEEAKRVAKLKKPSKAAAITNRLALSKPSSVGQLLEVTEEIRDAMSGQLDRDRVHELSREEARILDKLTGEAASLTEDDEVASAATLHRVRETLQAAQVDEGIRERLLAGRLEREERAASVGLGKSEGRSARAKPARTVDRKRVSKAKEKVAEVEKAARAAKREVANAEGALTKAQRALDAAEARAERARKALAAASAPT